MFYAVQLNESLNSYGFYTLTFPSLVPDFYSSSGSLVSVNIPFTQDIINPSCSCIYFREESSDTTRIGMLPDNNYDIEDLLPLIKTTMEASGTQEYNVSIDKDNKLLINAKNNF